MDIRETSPFGITLTESADALRLGTDSLLLSAYIKKQSLDSALEIGAGSGIISLLLARRGCFKKIHAAEIQGELFDLLEKNVKANGFGEIIAPVNADIRTFNPELCKGIKVVFSNPPYMKTDSGKASPLDCKQISRHEVNGGVFEFCAAAARLLKTGGRLYLVYRPDRLDSLMHALKANGFAPKRMTFVHADTVHAPSSVLCEATLNGGEQLRITRPLFLNDGENQSEDCRFIYENGVFPDDFFIK